MQTSYGCFFLSFVICWTKNLGETSCRVEINKMELFIIRFAVVGYFIVLYMESVFVTRIGAVEIQW